MELFGHFKTLDEMTLRIVTHRGSRDLAERETEKGFDVAGGRKGSGVTELLAAVGVAQAR